MMDDEVRCLFCRTTTGQRSREHVLRQWFKKRIPTYGSMRIERDGLAGLERAERPTSPFDLTVNKVCVPCNSGWLNRLENAVGELVVDLSYARPRALPQPVAAKLAFWCTTRALLRTYLDHSRGESADPAIFHKAFLLQAPPPGVEVHIGFCERYVKAAGSNTSGPILEREWQSDGTHIDTLIGTANVVSFGIGAFYFQVSLPSDIQVARDDVAASMNAIRAAYPDKFMTLHPALAPAPPTAILTAEDAGRCGNPRALRGQRAYLPSDFDQIGNTMPTPLVNVAAATFWQSQRRT